jgi:transcriptional regulator with XRE-family HTH domain
MSAFAIPIGITEAVEMAYDVPDFIDAVMEALKISQEHLGRQIGVSQSTISKWRRLEHDPKKSEWDRLVSFARKQPKTKHLVAEAPVIENPLDDLVRPFGREAEASARIILEAFVKTLPKKP